LVLTLLVLLAPAAAAAAAMCRVRYYQSDVWELYQGDQNDPAVGLDCIAYAAQRGCSAVPAPFFALVVLSGASGVVEASDQESWRITAHFL
jgi:hypothetical protein